MIKFIHIPKTAGTSIVETIYSHRRVHHQLASDVDIKEWENNIWFAVIRNPYDRFISAWHYHRIYNDHYFKREDMISSNITIDQYVDFAKEIDKDETLFNFKSQVEYINRSDSDKKEVDVLLSFEKLEIDWSNFSRKHGLPRNLSIIKETRIHKNYRNFYTDKARAYVEERYMDDIDRFKYVF